MHTWQWSAMRVAVLRLDASWACGDSAYYVQENVLGSHLEWRWTCREIAMISIEAA